MIKLLSLLFTLLLVQSAWSAPKVVTVGAFLNNIQNLDLKSHSYNADVYIWFKWTDPEFDPSETFEFVNPQELWGHTQTKAYEKPEKIESGEFYQVVRVHGRFGTKFDLSNYPFDIQRLTVEFEDSSNEAGAIKYITDNDPIRVNDKLTLPGFIFGEPRISILEQKYSSNFGDSRIDGNSRYSRVRIELPIHRPRGAYAIKFLLPIACVVFCASLMFLFSPKYVDARVGVGITALLTIVALQLTLGDNLPEVDYLVLIDKIYLGAYIYVVAGLALVVRTTWMLELHEEDPDVLAKANKLDLIALGIFSVVYLLAVVTLLVLAL